MSDPRQRPVRAVPRLNRERFELECLRRRLHTDTDRAKALGISQAQLSKIMLGQRRPGGKFIHACMALFTDCDYDDLFTDPSGTTAEGTR